MKKLILLTTALLLASFTYAGEGEAKKSCDTEKKACCCETCDGSKPEGKCCCADKAKDVKKSCEAPTSCEAPKEL